MPRDMINSTQIKDNFNDIKQSSVEIPINSNLVFRL